LAQADLLFTSRTPFEERLNEKIALTYPHLPIKDIAAASRDAGAMNTPTPTLTRKLRDTRTTKRRPTRTKLNLPL
jgi:hypothetical protein